MLKKNGLSSVKVENYDFLQFSATVSQMLRARRDLNPRHPEPESGALSTELRALSDMLLRFHYDVRRRLLPRLGI